MTTFVCSLTLYRRIVCLCKVSNQILSSPGGRKCLATRHVSGKDPKSCDRLTIGREHLRKADMRLPWRCCPSGRGQLAAVQIFRSNASEFCNKYGFHWSERRNAEEKNLDGCIAVVPTESN